MGMGLGLGTGVGHGRPPSSTLLKGLAASLGLHDAANGNRLDASGKGWTLTDTGSNVGQAAGLIGSAAQFNHTAFQALSNGANIIESGPVSVSAWFNLSSILAGMTLFKMGGQVVMAFSSTQISFGVDGAGDVATPKPSTSAWHHAVGTFDGSVVSLYLDGVLKGQSSGFSYTSTLEGTFVGNSGVGANASVAGLREMVPVWSRQLTDGGVTVGQTAGGEIARLWNNGNGIDYPFVGA